MRVNYTSEERHSASPLHPAERLCPSVPKHFLSLPLFLARLSLAKKIQGVVRRTASESLRLSAITGGGAALSFKQTTMSSSKKEILRIQLPPQG
jgi:hypothetical protein